MLLDWFLPMVCRRGQRLVGVTGFARRGIVWEWFVLPGGRIE
jgi:hypothetical protein